MAWLDGKSPSIRSSPRAASLPAGKPETDSEDESYSGVSWSAGPADENPLGLPSQPHRTPAPASIPKGQQVPQLGQAAPAVPGVNGFAGAQAASQSKLAAAATNSAKPSPAIPEGGHAVGEDSTGLAPARSAQGVSISVAAQQPVSKPTQSPVPARESVDRRLKGNYRNITELHCTVNPARCDIKYFMEAQGATRPDQHGSAGPRKAAVGTPNPVTRPPNAGKTPMAAQGTNGPNQHSSAGLREAAGVSPNPVSHSPSTGEFPLAAQGVSMPTYASKRPMAPQRANHTDKQAKAGLGKDARGTPSQAVDTLFHIFNGPDDSAHSGGCTDEVHLHLPFFVLD